MLLLMSDVRPEKLGDSALIEIVPPLYDVIWAVEIVAGPAMVRFTLDKVVRALSSTVPPFDACNVETFQPLASVKPVSAPTFNTLLLPSLSRTTVPVSMVLSADNVTVPPAIASN